MIPPVNYLSPTAEIQKKNLGQDSGPLLDSLLASFTNCCAEDNWTSFLLCKIELTVTGIKCWGAAPLF
jgi:hypothetical protein